MIRLSDQIEVRCQWINLRSTLMHCSCQTCRQSNFECPGHFGHIELPVPVFHPLFLRNLYQIMRGVCTFCHHFISAQDEARCGRATG